MGAHHNSIIKLSKINIAVALASYVSLGLYILSIILTCIGMNEDEMKNMEFPWWIFAFLGLLVVSILVYTIFDVIIAIYALVYMEKFHNSWVPWAIAGSCGVAFFVSPFLGFCGMIVNISFCRMDIRDAEKINEESVGLINNNNNVITTATVVYPIPSCNIAPPQAQQHNQSQPQPIYYATPVQYPTYGQQNPPAANVVAPSAVPQTGRPLYGQSQQIPSTNAFIPQHNSPSAMVSPVPPIYPNVSSLSAAPPPSSNTGTYGYPTYNYNQK